MFPHLLYVAREDYALFWRVAKKIDPRASSGKFLRVKSRYPECCRFLCLWGTPQNRNFFCTENFIRKGGRGRTPPIRNFYFDQKTGIGKCRPKSFLLTSFRSYDEVTKVCHGLLPQLELKVFSKYQNRDIYGGNEMSSHMVVYLMYEHWHQHYHHHCPLENSGALLSRIELPSRAMFSTPLTPALYITFQFSISWCFEHFQLFHCFQCFQHPTLLYFINAFSCIMYVSETFCNVFNTSYWCTLHKFVLFDLLMFWTFLIVCSDRSSSCRHSQWLWIYY